MLSTMRWRHPRQILPPPRRPRPMMRAMPLGAGRTTTWRRCAPIPMRKSQPTPPKQNRCMTSTVIRQSWLKQKKAACCTIYCKTLKRSNQASAPRWISMYGLPIWRRKKMPSSPQPPSVRKLTPPVRWVSWRKPAPHPKPPIVHWLIQSMRWQW